MSGESSLRSMLKGRARLLQWFSIVAAVAFVAWILATRRDDLSAAFALTPRLFALISASALATFVVNGFELKVLANRFDRSIPFGESMLLGLMVSTLNYLPMKTGTLLNGVLMKARYEISLAHFGALVAGSSVIHLWVALVCAGAVLAVDGTQPMLAWGLLLGPTILIAALVLWGRSRTAGRYEAHDSRLVRVAWRAVDGLGLIFGSWRLLAIEVVINVVLVMLASVRTLWSLEALSTDAGLATATVITAIGIVAARLSVIPGGIGFKEGGAAVGAAMAGLDSGLGLAAAVIDRAVTLVWLLLLGVPGTLYLQRITGIKVAEAQKLAGRATDGGDAQ